MFRGPWPLAKKGVAESVVDILHRNAEPAGGY